MSATATRNQRRYMDWLAQRIESDQSFGEWLKAGAGEQPPEDNDCNECIGTGLDRYGPCGGCRGRGYHLPQQERDYD
jgi:hypothetical protein